MSLCAWRASQQVGAARQRGRGEASVCTVELPDNMGFLVSHRDAQLDLVSFNGDGLPAVREGLGLDCVDKL